MKLDKNKWYLITDGKVVSEAFLSAYGWLNTEYPIVVGYPPEEKDYIDSRFRFTHFMEMPLPVFDTPQSVIFRIIP